MPKNNSRKRKDERKKRAQEREQEQVLYAVCGHRHTDNGYFNCLKQPTKTAT